MPAPAESAPDAEPLGPLESLKDALPAWAQADWIWQVSAVLLALLVGIPLVRMITGVVRKASMARMNVQSSMLVTKATKYALYIILILTLLSQFGVNLAAILGAAGVAGVAIGFASQTSLSNVISGLFLIGERPFSVGDLIEVSGVTGVVDSINLLSCNLRTLDNKSVRVPNEMLVKSVVTNVTKHPIRRAEVEVGVSYSENIEHVERVLHEIIYNNPLALDEPAPIIINQGFGDSSINFKVGAWAESKDFLTLRNALTREIKVRFEAEDIEIPFPHITRASGKSSVDHTTDD